MHRRPTSELLPLDLEIGRTLSKLKRVKAYTIRMEYNNSDRYSEGHSDQNEKPETRELTLEDC